MTGCARMLDENKTREQLIDELHQARRTADEFKALNESINETASLYRQVVDKTDEAVFVIQEGWIKFANEMALKMTGYSKEDVSASAAISAFVHPDDQEPLAQYHERRLKGAEPNYKLPFRFVRKDGTVGWAEINSSLIMWEGRPAALCLMAGITGRKKAEQALQESRDIFKVIIDSLPVGMLYVDSHERIVFANNTFRSWWRIPDSDLSGHTLEDTLGNHYPIIKSTVKAVLAGQEMTYQRPVKYKDGVTRDIVASYAPHVGDDGAVKGFACLIEDVTQLKQVERELRESEQRLGLALRGGALGLWDWDLKTGRAIWDERATLMMEYGVGELAPNVGTWKRTVHPDDWEKVSKVLNSHMVGLIPAFEAEFRMRAKSGDWRWFQARGKIVDYDNERKPQRITGTILDITDRKEAEEALRRSEESFRQIVEGAPEPVFVHTGGLFAYLNLPALKLFGANSPDDLLGKPIMDRFHPSEHELIKERIRTLTVEKKQVAPLEEIWTRIDGAELNVDVSAVPINFRGQNGALVFAHDLADRKLVEQERQALQTQLIQAQKMEALGTLVGGIAHDFNNMLQTILGYSELLLMDKQEGQKGNQELQTIIETGKGGAELVKKLLAFGQQAPIFSVHLDLNHQIAQLEPLISRTLPQVVALDFDLTDDQATIHADPNQIDQIIMNLAINASDAMPNGGRLMFSTRAMRLDDEYCRLHHGFKAGRYVMLSVSDTGKGMDRTTLSRVFDPFFSTKQRGSTKGTGLGLAVVQGIVEKGGGHITCESELGKGSKFTIYFPAFESTQTPDQEVGSSSQSAVADTILVIEDVSSIAELTNRVLTKAGYSVIIAGNGQEALEIFETRKGEISLVILDLLMPEMSGKDCLMEMVRIDPSVRVLIASGFAPEDELHEKISPLVKGFLHKPFAIAELLAAVVSALGRN